MYQTGFKPSPNDYRDYIYGKLIGANFSALPSKFLHDRIPINEQVIGDCVGQATRSIKYVQERINYPNADYDFSPGFTYALCKSRDGMPNEEGTFPRIAMKVTKELGAAQKHLYPNQDDGINLDNINQEALDNAKLFKIGAYARIQTIEEMKDSIKSGSPVMAGLIITTNFVESEIGFVNLPGGYFLGGHAVALDGWDDNLEHTFKDGTKLKGFFRFINSWGEDWGDRGYGYLPYNYVNYSNDLGMKFFSEAWSSVDVILPNENTEKMILWIDKKEAVVNGKVVHLDQAPTIEPKSNRTLVPLRFIAETFNKQVDYIPEEKKIIIK